VAIEQGLSGAASGPRSRSGEECAIRSHPLLWGGIGATPTPRLGKQASFGEDAAAPLSADDTSNDHGRLPAREPHWLWRVRLYGRRSGISIAFAIARHLNWIIHDRNGRQKPDSSAGIVLLSAAGHAEASASVGISRRTARH